MTPSPDTPDLATPERMVEELRSNADLVVCPYDRRSPDYWTAPHDAPCRFCGGLPDGPDKCTGADLRIMPRAAALIEAQAARIRKLESEVAGLKSLMWPESITAQVGHTSCAVCGTAHHAADECPRCDLESVASRLA